MMATAAPDIDRMVRDNMRLVVHIAKGFHSPLGLEELVGFGNVGLVVAAKKFDPRRGVKFSTHAGHWIRAFIARAIQHDSGVDTTHDARKLFWGLKRAIKAVGDNDGCATAEDVAEFLNINVDTVRMFMPHLLRGKVWLDRVVGSSTNGDLQKLSLRDLLLIQHQTPEDIVAEVHDREATHNALMKVMATLTERERFVIEQRFLVEDKQRLRDVGDKLGISRERVRLIQDRAFKKLQIRMRKHERA